MVLIVVCFKQMKHANLLVGFEAVCTPSSWVPVFSLLRALIWVQRVSVCVCVYVVNHSLLNANHLFRTAANNLMPAANSG